MPVNLLAKRHAAELEMKISPHGYTVQLSEKGMIGPHFDIVRSGSHVATLRYSSQSAKWRLFDPKGVHSPEVQSIEQLTPDVLVLLGIAGDK